MLIDRKPCDEMLLRIQIYYRKQIYSSTTLNFAMFHLSNPLYHMEHMKHMKSTKRAF